MIEILLPVYNGEKYLREQIESILKQTNQNWILKIRNDGSKDKSQYIISKFCKKYPSKIVQIDCPKENVGLVQSINYLQQASPHGDYIMFADQDDIWLPHKIDKSLQEVKNLENGNTSLPVMVCSDVKCVDQNLDLLEESFFVSQKFPKDILGDVNKMAALNIIQGCTIMINKSAAKLIFPMPLIMSIHDMWIGLICAYFGTVRYIETPLMLYRQHSDNVAGSIDVSLKYYSKRLLKIKDTITFLFKLNSHLPFKLNLLKVWYYKFKYLIKRI